MYASAYYFSSRQIFPGMLPWGNNHEFDINNISFWTKRDNPWQYIFDGYKTGVSPGKQGVQVRKLAAMQI